MLEKKVKEAIEISQAFGWGVINHIIDALYYADEKVELAKEQLKKAEKSLKELEELCKNSQTLDQNKLKKVIEAAKAAYNFAASMIEE